MTTELKILGIDVSKASITTHVLECYPKGGLKSYWDKTRNKLSTLYPTFHSSPDKKKKQKSAFDFAEYVLEVKPDYAILEPTGNHYSRIWAAILKKLEIKVLWVGHVELRRYRGGKNLPNKSDPADALAMAAYGHDPDHRLEDGNIKLKKQAVHLFAGLLCGNMFSLPLRQVIYLRMKLPNSYYNTWKFSSSIPIPAVKNYSMVSTSNQN
jgi:transposase